jgi:glycosyltransferase involved in cell wall biosynthesis/tetratricopeptide (TPR) repeat protein
MDAVWVPSQFNLETFSAAGVQREKLRVVPETVDEDLFDPTRVRPMKLVQPAAYNFLAVFEFIRRKGWDVLLRAYLTEFTADDNVCLHLRCHLANDVEGKQAGELRKRLDAFARTLGLDSARLPRIELLGMPLATRDLPALYAAVDCLVAPSRGEGWGRPQHEAMMMGLPVIATNWSGNTEFMTPETACLLDYELVKVEATDAGFEHYQGHRWAEPSCAHLRQWLRRLQQNPAEGKTIGARARAHVLKHFSIGSGTPIALQALAECRPATVSRPVVAKTSSGGTKRNDDVLINWIGSFLDHGSLSHVNRELVGSLKNISGLKIQAVTNGSPAAADAAIHWPELTREISSAPAPASELTVRHAWPPNWLRPASGKLVVIQPWEFGSLPEDWVQRARDVDEFWLPSEYVRQVYIASGVPAKKVFVVPNGADPEKFHPQVTPMKLATQRKFKFLFVGGTIGRKGPDLLVQAYLKNFTSADDVCLVIKDFGGKSVYTGQTFEAQIRAAQAIPNAPEILYLNEELPPESLPGLYTACDCFVLPYRGEGFGLPVLEAMACGLPVMVTAGGATDDFVRDEFAWRIPAVKKEFGHEAGGLKLIHAGWLLEPDLAVLGQQMRHVFANPAEARKRGQLASRHAHQFFSWKNSAVVVQQRISKLVGNHQLPAKLPRDLVKLPEVAHLGRLDEARELFAQKKFQAAWESTRTAMAKRPFHPEAFLFLAEIALAVGNGKAAKLCAQRARDFAPGWQAPKQFLAKPLKGDARLDWPVLQESIGNRLSVCLIVKNEEKFLAPCLKSVHGLAAQIIVLDTGSTDRTVEIAREFGAEIYSFAWCDDFAAARNAALEHATGDWVLMLDADEELPPAQHAALLADLKKSSTLAHRLPLVNAGQNDGRSFVPRLFRNAPGVYYSGRIHEQVFPSLLPHCKNWGLKTALGTAEILHHGYTQEMVHDRNKIERNLKLLRQAVEENPADVNLVMNLGLELVRSDDLAGGVEKYREAFQMMSAQPAGDLVPELREVLLTQFTSQLYKIRAHAEVVEILHSPLARQGGLTASLHLALGLAQFELKQFSEAADQMRQCLIKRKQPALSPINTDIHTAAPQHCLALSLAKLGDLAGAEKTFQSALAEPGGGENLRLDFSKFLAAQSRFVDALQQLHEIVAHNPRQAAAWRLGGEITLGRPELLEFAREWTGEAFRALPDDSALTDQCAEALLLNGDTASALELWEKIWDRDRSARTLAALILCEAVESPTTHAPDEGADELATSRAFIEWYQKLIAVRASALTMRINEQLDKLSRALPTAARMLESALQEAKTPAVA